MKLFSSVEAHLILMSASLLAGVGATPLPLALSADTAAVSRALEPRQFRASAPHEAINFNYVRDTHATDPSSYLVVAPGRGVPENTSPVLKSRSSESLMTRDSNIPMTRRADSDESPVIKFGGLRPLRPSLEAVDNPIQELLTNELAKTKYTDIKRNLAIRMLHVDLLFALAEEKDFKTSDVTALKEQIKSEHAKFEEHVNTEHEGRIARACISRLRYYEKVLENKDKVAITPPPRIPGHYQVDRDNYTMFLLKTMKEIGTKSSIMKDRITYLGLNYNFLKLDGVRNASFELNVYDSYIKEFKEAGAGECKARAEYYYEALIQLAGKVD